MKTRQFMKSRQSRIFLSTLGAIILGALFFALFLFVSSKLIGKDIHATLNANLFDVFSNTVGLAIAAAASIIAIILAYNSQHFAEVQTTTVALQEFKSEIDSFVGLANDYYDACLDLLSISLRLEEQARDISEIVHKMPSEGDILIYDELEASINTFQDLTRQFTSCVSNIQDLLTGAGNLFFRRMIERNFFKFNYYTNKLLEDIEKMPLDGETLILPGPYTNIDYFSVKKSDPRIVSQLYGFALGYPLIAVLEKDSDEQNLRDANLSAFMINLSLKESDLKYDVIEVFSTLAKYLPVLESTKDFNLDALVEEFGLKRQKDIKTEFDEWIEKVKSGEIMATDLSRKASNSLPVYRYILPFYFAMADTESGIIEMRDFFQNFGAKEEALHQFIDIHSARLKFTYRFETSIIFEPCARHAKNST